MTWITICDCNPASDRSQQFPPVPRQNDPHALLPQGSFVAEAEATETGARARTIFQYTSDQTWSFSFNIRCDGDGRIFFQMRLAGASVQLETPPEPEMLTHPVRIRWIWDAPGRSAVFSVRDLADGKEYQVVCDTPFPLPQSEILKMQSGIETSPGSGLQFFAFSTEPMLAGPVPTLSGGTQVATTHGYRAVSDLKPGDLIFTSSDGPVPLRNLIQGEVPAMGWFRPLRIRAPYFELREDIVVAREQKLLMQGDTVEYLFGEEEVLAGVGQFADGISVLEEPAGETIRYFQLVFDQHQIIDLAGTFAESSFWPMSERVSRDLQHGMSLPVHKNTVRPVLRPYEALTLRALRHQ